MAVINQIILLQDVDNKLFEINKLLGDLPNQVQALTDQQEATTASLAEKEELLKTTTVDIHTSETLIATTQEKVDTLKDKLIDGSISNNKEYDAMMETIDYEKNIIFEKENQLLILMETKENLSKEIDEDKAALDGIIEELNNKKESLNKKVEDVSEEKNALTKERKDIVLNVDEDTLDKYMQIYEARSGVACSEILDNNCEGCGAYIPPQVVNEALAKIIVYCGTCSRFLHKFEN
jgi:predicted  nucleic acid-binding Zn-ribbon protein|tara:strand:- start:1076 stop:1783 length:708 start_codon:yes stop_codon:yes gene_type:complete